MSLSERALEKFGDPSLSQKHMTLWRPDQYITKNIKCIPSKIYCNKEIVRPLNEAFHLIIMRNLQNEIKSYDGCFNVREIRGVKDVWSTHSWGLAIDINREGNGLGQAPQLPLPVVACFKTAGFDWGGDFKRKDGMHFQLKELA